MLEFVLRAFRGFYTVMLWISLGASIIAGGVGGYFLVYEVSGAIIGAILGAIFGLIFIILTGGIVATFLNMNRKLEDIEELLKKK
ncbi:MAG: hypothetical protein FWD22_03005 [Treponema sp.]|nr:hypothetical protein [Treponema sp.]